MEVNKWVAIRDQSLAVYTRNAGFDLSVYDHYSDTVKAELRKKAIDEALFGISNAITEILDGFDIYSVTKGVYVITISNPLSIGYEKGRSQVIYIGLGNIMGRTKSHFQGKLFDFMQSLSGANFGFSFAKPELDGHPDYYKHVEWQMLDHFKKSYGRYPLFNKNAGSKKVVEGGTDWWKSPLKNSGKRPKWCISPTEHSDFGTLD